MSPKYPPIRIYNESGGERFLVMRDGVNLTFYMRRSHGELRHAVMRALDVFCRAVGKQTLAWYVDDSGEWKHADDRGWAYIVQELSSPAAARIMLYEVPFLECGFEYHGLELTSPPWDKNPNVVSALSVWLPTNFLEQHGPARVRELAMELGAELPFNSGFAGLCFQFPEDYLGPGRYVRKVCFDHPGIAIPNLSGVSTSIGTRVRTVAWLNFLGQPMLDAVGGASALRARLTSPGVTVQEMNGDRALVTLGPWPEAGDKDPERTLAPYRELAHLLEPWLHHPSRITDGFTEEDMRRWERRFLDG